MTAVVTGGASGLGAATVERLTITGATAVAVDLRTGCDVTDDVASEAEMAAIVERHGPPRVLVTCAGVQEGRRVVRRDGSAVDLGWFRRSVEVNLVGAFNWVRLAAAQMAVLDPLDADGTRGVIVLTSSITAEDGVDGGVAYAAAKAGVAGMALPLARELAPYGIRAVAIEPGVFDTPMAATMPADYAESLLATVPHPPRLGGAGEFADLVLHVIANDMLNGCTIRLDGGLRMQPGRLRQP